MLAKLNYNSVFAGFNKVSLT